MDITEGKENIPTHNPELVAALESIVANPKFDMDIRARYGELLNKPKFLRDEGTREHFSTYILPYNPKDGTVFIVFHKKANQWIAPGGHIDSGESLLQTINREAKEELGVIEDKFPTLPEPIHISILDIEVPRPTCLTHYDIWYKLETDGSDFVVNPEEFSDFGWKKISEAKKLMTDPTNLEVLDLLS